MIPDPNLAADLFDRALDFEPRERAAFLAGACGNDVNLRRRVEDLLLAHDAKSSFSTRDQVVPKDGNQHDLQDPQTITMGTSVDEAAGTRIDRYKLLEKLGEGGFGAVWAAEQKEPVKRRVALKIIKLGMDTKQVVARFEAERQALALMDHPNIAKVLDAGATDTGRPYFVMELVKGVPITRYCDQEKVDTNQQLALFVKVCHAIQHAHQKGIIHRDIKPSNIMVTLHDGVPVPKVIDFGIAKATQQELTEKTIYTQFNQFIGTPAYMSPEQAELSGLDIDTRSDIYSLGVLLYELLTGSTPFDTKELLQSGLDEMRKIIREREPVRPSTRVRQTAATSSSPPEPPRIARHSPLSTDLDWIVMKCLEKDRARRYETANGLAADIHRYLNNEPVTAVAPTFVYQLRKFYRRNRAQVRVAAGVVALLVLTAVFSALQAVKATRQEQRARTAQRTAEMAEQAAIDAKEETRIKLYRSLVEQARAVQLARRSGFRADVWQILKDAMSIGGILVDPSELRSIAVACLDEPNRLEWQKRLIPDAGAWVILGLTETYIAMGADDGRVQVRDALDGTKKASFRGGHSEAIASVVKLAGDDTWASSDVAGNIILWRRNSRSADWNAERLQADGMGGIPKLLACGDGLLAYAVGSSKILIWKRPDSPQTGVVPLPFELPMPLNRSVGVSPDGRFLLVPVKSESGRETTAHVWDLVKQEEAKVLPAPVGVRRVLFSGDGSIAVCASSKQLMVYDARQWKQLSSRRSRSWLSADNVAISGNGRVIAFGGGIKTIWNVEYDVEMSTLTEADGYPMLSEDGSRLTILRTDLQEWRLERWQLGRSDTMLAEEAHSSNVFGLGISPNGHYLASSGMDGQVKLWSLDPWQRVSLDRPQFDSSVEDPSFSFDGQLLAVMSGPWTESQITFWNMETKRRIRSISFGIGDFMGLVSFHDSRPLVAAAAGNSLCVWRYRLQPGAGTSDGDLQLDPIIPEVTLQRPSAMVGLDSRARYVFWSEIERAQELSGFNRAFLQAMDLKTGRKLPFNRPVSSGWNEFAFMPDGDEVVLAACGAPGQPGRIEIWDFLKNERLAHFAEASFPEAPTPSVIALHPDGRQLVFQSTKNEALELWDIETRELICRFPLPEEMVTQSTGAVAGLKWSPNGELLAVPLSTGQIRIWNTPAVRRQLAELGLDWEDDRSFKH